MASATLKVARWDDDMTDSFPLYLQTSGDSRVRVRVRIKKRRLWHLHVLVLAYLLRLLPRHTEISVDDSGDENGGRPARNVCDIVAAGGLGELLLVIRSRRRSRNPIPDS